MLRSAQNLGPTALIGTTGISAGGGAGAFVGFGLLRFLNAFLARPFNKNLLKDSAKGAKSKQQEFIQRFKNSIPNLPDVPVSAVAVQPVVPSVVEQVQNQTNQ